MKRGLFIILFLVVILFISGLQSCQPTLTVGSPNACCKLSTSNNINCIGDISQLECDNLYTKYGSYYLQEIYQNGLVHSCIGVDGCDTNSLSCKYQDNIYQNGDNFCLEENSKIYNCNNGKWVQNIDCIEVGSCSNSISCINPSVSSTGCSSTMCGGFCEPICSYSSQCANTGTDSGNCYVDSMCNRNTNGLPCVGGFCSNGMCPACVPVCQYSNECSNTGTDNGNCHLDSLCDRNVNSLPCTGGICYDGICRQSYIIKSVDAGQSATCDVTGDGTVKCWGDNTYGELGDGTTIAHTIPASVSGINNAINVSVYSFNGCAVLSDGTVKCWGTNNQGELGDGTTTQRLTPVSVVGINNAVNVYTAVVHTCALLNTGGVKCWGDNYYGQLGDGTTTQRLTPVSVVGINNAVSISTSVSSNSFHSCALLSNKTIKCWGANEHGQLGDGTTNTYRLTPINVTGINNAVSIFAGQQYSCAVLSNGIVKCWGYNNLGQLGDGTTTQRLTPINVTGINNAVSVSGGYSHTCALLNDGTVKCWGWNGGGELGDGTTTQRLTPVSVVGINNAVSVSGGYGYSCALLSTGYIKCWGSNYFGVLGDGTNTNRLTPVNVIF